MSSQHHNIQSRAVPVSTSAAFPLPATRMSLACPTTLPLPPSTRTREQGRSSLPSSIEATLYKVGIVEYELETCSPPTSPTPRLPLLSNWPCCEGPRPLSVDQPRCLRQQVAPIVQKVEVVLRILLLHSALHVRAPRSKPVHVRNGAELQIKHDGDRRRRVRYHPWLPCLQAHVR